MNQSVLNILEQIKFPNSNSRKKISDKTITSFVLGDVRYRRFINGKLIGPSQYTKKYNELFQTLKEFIKEVDPNFNFTTIQVNKNVLCKPHVDSNNIGPSYIIGLGDYEGGRFIDDQNQYYDIKNKWLLFDGRKIHYNEEFTGNRYSIVYFTHNFKN